MRLIGCIVGILLITACSGEESSDQELTSSEPRELTPIAEIVNRLLENSKGSIPQDNFATGYVGPENGASQVEGGQINFSALDSDNYEYADLREFDSPAKNQGSRPTCTSFGIISGMENILAQQTGQFYDLSEEHLWSKYEQTSTSSALRAANRYFVSIEPNWPYNGQPTVGREQLERESIVRLATYDRTSIEVSTLRRKIESGSPAIAYFPSAGWRESSNNGGVLRHGNWSGSWWHVMVVSGVIQHPEVSGGGAFVVKDSYGPRRGDGGYWYIPFSHCMRNGSNRCGAIMLEGIETRL